MSLPPEHLRPKKMVCRPGEEAVVVPLTDEEWAQRIADADGIRKLKESQAKTQYIRDREDAYAKEVYPFLDEAKAMQELEGDSSLMDELKAKRAAIKARHPEA